MIKALILLLRPAHWVKNVFVLAPLVFAQRLTDPQSVHNGLMAFAAFCLASSAVYVFNDIRDRAEDRLHPMKRFRPIAAGEVSVLAATVLVLGLAIVSLALAASLGWPFFTVLAIYLALNQLYSAGLKHTVILDVMIVSLGFVLRVLAGGAAVRVQVSAWLLLCTFLYRLFSGVLEAPPRASTSCR